MQVLPSLFSYLRSGLRVAQIRITEYFQKIWKDLHLWLGSSCVTPTEKQSSENAAWKWGNLKVILAETVPLWSFQTHQTLTCPVPFALSELCEMHLHVFVELTGGTWELFPSCSKQVSLMQLDLTLNISPHHGGVLSRGFLKDSEMLKATWDPASWVHAFSLFSNAQPC